MVSCSISFLHERLNNMTDIRYIIEAINDELVNTICQIANEQGRKDTQDFAWMEGYKKGLIFALEAIEAIIDKG